MKKQFLGIVAMTGLLAATGGTAMAVPTYEITNIGINGYNSDPIGVNNNGQVVGQASTNAGYSTWIYDSTTDSSTSINPLTSANGIQRSSVVGFNNAGQVVGFAEIKDANGNYMGGTSWLYDGQTTITLGPTDGNKIVNGFQSSSVSGINDSGQVIGYSNALNGGVSAWLYDSATSNYTQLGFRTGTYVSSSNGNPTYSYAGDINNAGQVVGTSKRFEYGNSQDAWFYDNDTQSTTRIGLTGGVHTGSHGLQGSGVVALNEAGQAIGHSARYNGLDSSGNSVWIFDKNTGVTTEIGLTGTSEYTSNSGQQYNQATALNNVGQVIGRTVRQNAPYSAANESWRNGNAAWVYDGGQTIRLGHYNDTEYVRLDGSKNDVAEAINDAGQIIGYSERMYGASLGRTAWFYDLGTDSMEDLIFSTRSSDNYSYSDASFLADDGTVLGIYRLFDNDTSLGDHVFWWNKDEGFYDLGSLVAGGLDTNGWSSLYNAVSMNSLGQIIGKGKLSNGSYVPYLLTPQQPPNNAPVPEPATMLLFGTGLAGLIGGRLRRKP